MTMTRTRRSLALLAVGALAAAPLALASPTSSAAPAEPAAACPPGTVSAAKSASQRAFERQYAGGSFDDLLAQLDATGATSDLCVPVKRPEAAYEILGSEAQRNRLVGTPGGVPTGALRSGLAQQARMAAAASTVLGAQGTWEEVGKTPLIADDDTYRSVSGQGLADLAGRVDSLHYDKASGRLFATVGTGGVWMSTDLADTWRSIGDSLPYQSVGAVTYTSAGGGRVLVVSGEATHGGGNYNGLGAFWSDDLGATWQQARGIPDALMGFEIEVDPTDPRIVYAATSQGLYRSTDAGSSYVNVNLPTDDCAGVTGYDNKCFLANMVTDVEIQTPGGTTDVEGGRVIAAVGYRAGQAPLFDGSPASPRSGLYRSDTGAPGSFEFLDDIFAANDSDPMGFAVQNRIGRTEFGHATGPDQDHDYLYAIVQDAATFNGAGPTDAGGDPTTITGGNPLKASDLNGIYVSADWGDSWTRMADELELNQPQSESGLYGVGSTLGFGAGVQSWYDMWIEPDPTSALNGVPTRLVFGLEEVWESRLSGTPQDGLTQQLEPASFKVIGPYFADESCQLLLTVPACPTTVTVQGGTTTHPDQQGGVWIPTGDNAVTLVVGNDGGVYKQTVAPAPTGMLSKDGWGRGQQTGFHTLLPYSAEVSKDGTVWYGLQDNGSGKITPDGRQVMVYGGDGTFAAVDPDNPDIAYYSTPNNALRVTTDGGVTNRNMAPPVTGANFAQAFVMDPTDANHILTGGPEVVERTTGPEGAGTADPTGTGIGDGAPEGWVEVFNTGAGTQISATELHGAAAYVGFCSVCDIVNADPEEDGFKNGIATNVGGDAPPAKASEDGWHEASARGLPNRYITSIAVDPADPKRVVVTLGGYAGREWWPEGSYNDNNTNLGKGHVFLSTDAAETFTDISGSLPDVPATWVETNRDQLVVGTYTGVFLSSDKNGSSWSLLKGLPNAPVSTIRTRPGNDDEIYVATFGRGVWKYTFSSRSGAVAPPAAPPVTQPPSGAPLPATGLPVTIGLVGVLALAAGLLVRRRLA
jgi:hypothetical protein